jgi:pyruvate/2-oxoglutarate dehydrogenase complex dihydrolipoamide acyltransferase (E2) component
MKVKMKMPDLATNAGVEISVLRWLVEPGQDVKRGDPLLEVETDKAVQEVESIATGVLASVAVAEKESIAAGQVIAEIEVEGAVPAAPAAAPAETPTEQAVPAPTDAPRRVAPKKSGGMFARRRDETTKD